jgi:hypothetical protein
MWIAGAARFAPGEQQLLFLSAARSGAARTTALGMGQFTLRAHPRTGATMAERHLDAFTLGDPPLRRVRLERLLETIARGMARDGARPTRPLAPEPAEASDPSLPHATLDAYTLMADPGARWFEPDTNQPVVYSVDPAGDNTLGLTASLSAIDGAMAAWTNVTSASIAITRGGSAAPGPLVCDGVSQIVFNDPFDEMDNPVSCSGVLALGGYCSNSEHTTVSGSLFYRITEGNITFNRGFGACSFWNTANLAEVATHELGHTIGIGHSSEDNNAAPELKDATMYYRAHFDGRGAAVHADDIAAVRFIYPGGGTGDPNIDDSDADGWVDAQDNCVAIPNAAQVDSDADGFGDLCDTCPLIAEGTGDGTCQPIYTSALKVHLAGARSKLVWHGSIDLPAGTTPAEARALLVSAAGVVVDTASGVALTPRHAGTLRYASDRALITLHRERGGGYRVRVVARGVDLEQQSVPLVSANLQVGTTAYANSMSCARRGKRIRCLG